MRVWRLTSRGHASFEGEGARRAGGRWNRRGAPLVYTSESLALAALEYLVNVDPATAARDLVAVAASIPEILAVKRLSAGDLPRNWRSFPAPPVLADLGTRWIDSLETPVLSVPSVVVPQETNFLVNPRHPESRLIEVRPPVPFAFDVRVWRKRAR